MYALLSKAGESGQKPLNTIIIFIYHSLKREDSRSVAFIFDASSNSRTVNRAPHFSCARILERQPLSFEMIMEMFIVMSKYKEKLYESLITK